MANLVILEKPLRTLGDALALPLGNASDLFGLVYQGHPDLRRLLMPSDWMGYPMRKTYKEEDPRLVWNRR